MFYVYLLKSRKVNWLYVGATDDLRARFSKHNRGLVKSTKFYAPFEIMYYEAYLSLSLARKREYDLKNNSQQKEILLKRLGDCSRSGGFA
ncbi:GIY-YIG nuclease family protein [Candidatus Falkowbacteria bacterium]|nr:GIY-YIG nuclease family protein [Candidatus Falkowbacteria bacterium]